MENIFVLFFSIILFAGCGSELNADDLEAEIKNLIEQANYCEVDLDCELLSEEFSLGCPFGCFNLVNKNADFSKILDFSKKYFELENVICDYSCMSEPSLEEIKCVEGKCVDTRFNSR